jgi:hypothetical protein
MGPWPRRIFVVSLLAPEHVVKPSNFGSRLGYRPINTHWSDASIKPDFMYLNSLIGFMISLIFHLLIISTRCCSGLITYLIHIDESAIYVLIVARPSCLYVPLSEKLDSLLGRLGNRCMMHGSQSDVLNWWCGNRNDTHLCSDVTLVRL